MENNEHARDRETKPTDSPDTAPSDPDTAWPILLIERVSLIVLTAIVRGQAPAIILGAILLVCVIRMPPADLIDVVKSLSSKADILTISLGILSVLLVFGWYTHAKWVRRDTQKKFKAYNIDPSKLEHRYQRPSNRRRFSKRR